MKQKRFVATPRRRNWHCGDVYHVYQRGNYKQQIFFSEVQLSTYLQRLDLLAERYAVRIHGFCLMSNHVHFLVETSRRDGISRFMQALQAYHSRWIHGTQQRDGHLWKNRFGAKPIKSASHYRQALLYIERNPVMAVLVERAEDYTYSSAAAHASNSPVAIIGQAKVRLYLDRWRRECQSENWSDWLRDPQHAAFQQDLAEVRQVLGNDRQSSLNPIALPMPMASARAAPTAAKHAG